MYKFTDQFKASWRTHECPTSQGVIYPGREVEAGFGIEALMAGSDIDGDASGDPEALSGGDLRCGTAMVCVPSYVGECL